MRRPTLFTLFLVVFVDLIGFGLILPVISYFSKELGATATQAGIIIASYSVMQFIFAPVWGSLSDRFGRRPIILISLAGSVVSYLLFANSCNLTWILVSRIFAGICGANISVANAYVADITSEKDRSKGMGMIGAAFGIGFVAGPLIGAGLSAKGLNTAHLGYFAAAICLINLLCALKMLPESLPKEKRSSHFKVHLEAFTGGWSKAIRSKEIIALIGITFLTNIAFTMWEICFPYFLQDSPYFHAPKTTYFMLVAFVGIVTAIVQGGMIHRITTKFSDLPVLKFSIICFALSLSLIPFAKSMWVLVAILFFMAFASSFTRPLTYSLISKASTPQDQGKMLGVGQSASSLTRIIGPIFSGALFDIKMGLPFWLGGLSVALGLILILRLKLPQTSST